jgi:hypothetical protein
MPKLHLGGKAKGEKKGKHEHGEHGPCPFCKSEYLVTADMDEDMQKVSTGEWTQVELCKKKLEMIAKAEVLLRDLKVKYEAELAIAEKKQ